MTATPARIVGRRLTTDEQNYLLSTVFPWATGERGVDGNALVFIITSGVVTNGIIVNSPDSPFSPSSMSDIVDILNTAAANAIIYNPDVYEPDVNVAAESQVRFSWDSLNECFICSTVATGSSATISWPELILDRDYYNDKYTANYSLNPELYYPENFYFCEFAARWLGLDRFAINTRIRGDECDIAVPIGLLYDDTSLEADIIYTGWQSFTVNGTANDDYLTSSSVSIEYSGRVYGGAIRSGTSFAAVIIPSYFHNRVEVFNTVNSPSSSLSHIVDLEFAEIEPNVYTESAFTYLKLTEATGATIIGYDPTSSASFFGLFSPGSDGEALPSVIAYNTAGITLSILNDSSPAEFVVISQVTGINGIGSGARNEIDVTDLETGRIKEYEMGKRESDSVSFSITYDPSNDLHNAFRYYSNNGLLKRFKIVLPDVDNTEIEFDAYIKSCATPMPLGDKLTMIVDMKCSGGNVWA